MQSLQLLCVGAFWLMSLCEIRFASASAISISGRSPPGQNFISPGIHYSTLATLKNTEPDNLDIDGVDSEVFQQILDMDDDDQHDFSKPLVYSFFEQAEQTFKQMDEALANSNLKELHALGHYLKGSSATMGLTYVKDDCQKIQNFGEMKDVSGDKNLSQADSLRMIQDTLPILKSHFEAVKEALQKFYEGKDAE